MKDLFRKASAALAASALAEIEGSESVREMFRTVPKQSFADQIEERLVEVAYAEAADYDDIRKSLSAETETAVRPDECQFGDNDLCFQEA